MILTYHGGGCYKVQHGNTVVAVNPPSKDSTRFKVSKFGSDIVLSSLRHPDWNGIEQATHGATVPFAVTGPGEYENKDIFIRALESRSMYGTTPELPRINTIYTFIIDNISMCFLGALTDKDLPKDTREAIEEVDILIVPVDNTGNEALSPKDAYSLAVSFEPKMIIPCPFDQKAGSTVSLEAFLKEAGVKNIKEAEQTDKLTIKRKELDGKESSILIINQS